MNRHERRKAHAESPVPDVLLPILDSISRRKANFGVCVAPQGTGQPFWLQAGSFQAVRVNGGFVVCMGLTRERLTELRDDCNALLAQADAPTVAKENLS